MNILIIEDDENILTQVSKAMKLEGYTTIECDCAEDADYYVSNGVCDAAIIDRMLPGMDGLNFLRKIRKDKISLPVILLTALDTVQDKIDGLESGADDYLAKPFDMRELIARIHALERRPANIETDEFITVFDFSYNKRANEITGPRKTISLTKKTNDMLLAILNSPNYTIERNKLFYKIWGIDSDVEEGNIDSYSYFLRKKLVEIGSTTQLICKKGIGYSLILGVADGK